MVSSFFLFLVALWLTAITSSAPFWDETRFPVEVDIAISTAPQPSAFSYLRLQAGPRHSEVCLGRAGWVVWRCFKFVAYLTCQSFEGYDYVLNQYLLSNRGTACCICCAQSKSSQGIAMCHDRLVHTHDISWKWWWWWWWRRWWFFQV